jgi:hypothetical protein
MIEQEKIKQQMAQIQQDDTNLDYGKWSFEQRRANRPFSHELWLEVRDRTLQRQQSENSELRRKRLAKLDDEKKARQAETDAQTDLALAPEKRRLQNQWLVDNPTQTAADFEKKAWHLLKENLLEQRNADSFDAEVQRQKASGLFN